MRWIVLGIVLLSSAGWVRGDGLPTNWLAKQQDTYGTGGWRDGTTGKVSVGATSLSLLAYLGAGYTDRGGLKDNRYARNVRFGIKFLLKRQDDAGRFEGADAREQALGALALSEAYWMTGNPRYMLPARRALATLAKIDAKDDPVARGLRVAAFKSAKYGGLDLPDGVFRVEKRWLDEHPPQTARETAVALISRIFLGEDPRKSETIRAFADRLLKQLPDPALEKRDPYTWWFATLGLFQVGGSHWKGWNKAMKDAIARTQREDGLWEPGPLADQVYGRVGATGLMTMCLEVYYRYDKVFGSGRISQTLAVLPSATTWRRSSLAAHSTRIRTGDGFDLPLDTVDARVSAAGFRARVELSLYFHFDGERRIEGTFQLRLPDGASPHHLAFGAASLKSKPTFGKIEPRKLSWSGLKVARMVPRSRASRAYEVVSSRRVDPALLEWAGGGMFNARLFPLMPSRYHRVDLAYDVDLTPVGDQLRFELVLPETRRPPRINGTEAQGLHFTVTHPREPLIALAGAGYTAIRVTPDLPSEPAPGPERAIFLLDTSLSSRDAYAVYRRLMDSILSANRDVIRKFKVVSFDTTIRATDWRSNPQDVARTIDETDVELSGATDLASALRSVQDEQADLFLLSDAHDTAGPMLLDIPRKGRLFAYRTGLLATDLRNLEEVADAVFHVAGEGDLEAASRAHRVQVRRIAEVVLGGCTDVLHAPTLYPGQSLTLAGRGRATGKLRLRFAEGGEWATEISDVEDSPLAERVYGEMAVGGLEKFAVQGQGVAEAYARHFRVVGETCSLVMLESKAQYKEFGIKPEDDAGVVSSVPVRPWLKDRVQPTVAQALRARLDVLPTIPGISFKAKPGLAEMLDHLPDEAFHVPVTGIWKGAEVELNPANAATLRSEGKKLLDRGAAGDAFHLFLRAAHSRPYDPWSYQHLALACKRLDRPRLGLMFRTIVESFDSRRWDTFHRDSLSQLLCTRILELEPDKGFWAEYAARRLAEIKYGSAADLVVVLRWDTEESDVDLHVVDPFGDVCNWRHPRNSVDGRLQQDCIDGYGPEIYLLEKAVPGTYVVRANYFRPDPGRERPLTKAHVTVIRNAGRLDATKQHASVELTLRDQMVEVLRVTVPGTSE